MNASRLDSLLVFSKLRSSFNEIVDADNPSNNPQSPHTHLFFFYGLLIDFCFNDIFYPHTYRLFHTNLSTLLNMFITALFSWGPLASHEGDFRFYYPMSPQTCFPKQQ